MQPREHYAHQLEMIRDELGALGELVAAANARALDALMHQDIVAARDIIADDHRIDQAQYSLEGHVVTVIATQQPVARDLRQLIAAIAIASELERIADYAKGIAKLLIQDAELPWVPLPDGLVQMAEEARALLDSALAAFIQQDAAAAWRLGEAENQVDALRRRVVAGLVDLLRQRPASTERVVDLLFVTHSLERMADRATNIAERVVYIVSGDVVELNP